MENKNDIIFKPLKFKYLTVKNRLFRSNLAGRFGNYDGSGSQARINWETSFAKGGVGAIISSFTPVSIRGRILPNYACIDHDDRIQFWSKVVKSVHQHDCKYIMQLSHSGRQRDNGGVESLSPDKIALSSTSSPDPFHGIQCRAMTIAEIEETIDDFAQGARRAREAGIDGVELHGANGYLITQFLSSAINNRTDQYGGTLENRARFVREIVAAIRKEVGDDFHLQMKINAVDYDEVIALRHLLPFNLFNLFTKEGNTLEESIQICKWLEEDSVDALHISVGSLFPHPLNPPSPLGDKGFPLDYAVKSYGTMMPSGNKTLRNYLAFKYKPLRWFFRRIWDWYKKRHPLVEGINAKNARAIKQQVNIPVLCTGGFQNAPFIREKIEQGYFDGVTIARALLANRDLPKIFAEGKSAPERPCTHCNKCLLYAPAYPLGCYELDRFDGDEDKMIKEIYSVYDPAM